MPNWQRLAGDFLPELLRSKDDAIRLVEHPLARVRGAAIQVLNYHWKCREDGRFAKICESLGTRDPDMFVRHNALLALGSCFQYTDDTRISVLLAKIVCNQTESDEIRHAAYLALLSVRKPATRLHPTPLVTMNGIRKEIDWGFVEESLDASRPTVPVDRFATILRHVPQECRVAFESFRKATAAFDRGEYEASIELYSDALHHKPEAWGMYVARARAYIELGMLDEALADLSRALDLNPRRVNAAKAHRERAHIYRKKGAIDLAEQDENAAAELERATEQE